MQRLVVDREETFGLRISRRLKGEQSLEVLTGSDMGNESREVAADHSHRYSIRCRMDRSLVAHVELWILFVDRQKMRSAPISPPFFQHHLGPCTTSVHQLSDNLVRAKVSLKHAFKIADSYPAIRAHSS